MLYTKEGRGDRRRVVRDNERYFFLVQKQLLPKTFNKIISLPLTSSLLPLPFRSSHFLPVSHPHPSSPWRMSIEG